MNMTNPSALFEQTLDISTKVTGKTGGSTNFLINYLIASLTVLVISLVLLALEPKIYHWFVIPAMLCGTLMGADLMRWLRGTIDSFDPKVLVAIGAFHGYFLAPLLHVYWNLYGEDLVFTGDARVWLGIVCSLTAIGMVFYKLAQRWSFGHTRAVRTLWQLVPDRLLPVLAGATVVAVLAKAYIWVVAGGISQGAGLTTAQAMMQGMGWMQMLSDSFPILLLVGFITWTTATSLKKRYWVTVIIILILWIAVQFVWVGFRGSRSAILAGIFWALGLVHHYWRRLGPVHLMLGFALLVPFLYFYGVYVKSARTLGEGKRLEQRSGRSMPQVLLGDLSRTDVQARIANEVVKGDNHYELRYGRTYLHGLSKIIPTSLWELLLGDAFFKVDWDKKKAFTELNDGKGSYDEKRHYSSRVYALTGEAMLNFGLPGVLAAWLLFGLVMGWLRKKMETLKPLDTRWGIMPYLSLLMLIILISDFDLVVFGTGQRGFLVLACIFLWSYRSKLKPE